MRRQTETTGNKKSHDKKGRHTMKNGMYMTTNPGIETEQNRIAFLLKMADGNEPPDADDMHRRENLFASHDVAESMLLLLKNAEQKHAVYQMEYLRTAYEEFDKREQALFSLQDLFDEGWLVACLGEWDFNISYKSEYERIHQLSSEKDTQIVLFLKELSKLPYRSQLLLSVSLPEDCSVPEGILQRKDGESQDGESKDGEAYLDPNGKLWLRFAEELFGKWWDELMEPENPADSAAEEQKKQQTEQWFVCWDAFYRCWTPDCYCEHVRELFETCLEKLEAEMKNMPWERMEHVIRRMAYLKYHPKGDMPYDTFMQDYPDTKMARTLYVNRHSCFELAQMPERLSRLYQLCLRQYDCADRTLRMRLLACMQNPWMYLHFYSYVSHSGNISFLTDCLSQAALYVPAANTIWQMCHTLVTKTPSVGEKFLEELNQNLFQIAKHGIEWENEAEWLSVTEELIWYLNEKSRWYFKEHALTRNSMQTYMQQIYAVWFEWYKEHLFPEQSLHQKILEHFQSGFENSGERDAAAAFAAYVSLLGMQRTEEAAIQMFEAYQRFFERICTEDTFASQLSWTFWLDDCWIFMMRDAASDRTQTAAFLKLLEPGFYKQQADAQKERSPMLWIGRAAAIQLYLMTVLLIEARDDTGKKYRGKVQTAFADCFLGYQIKECDLFDPESVRLLESEFVMRRCMEVFPLLDDTNRMRILSEMKQASPEKLVFLLQHIQHADIRTQWIQLLIQRQEEDFTESICFIPTYMKLVDCLMELCFQDAAQGQKLVQKTNALLERFQILLQEKGGRIEQQYASWVQSAKLRMKLLTGHEQEVLDDEKSVSALFYQALIYLNKEDLDSLKQAEKIYADLCKDQDEAGCAVYINAYAACVRICVHTETTDTEKEQYAQKAEAFAKDIRAKFALTSSDLKILLSNEMFLYLHLNDHEKFWKSASRLPQELKYEFSCAQYIVQMLIAEHKTQDAKEYMEELSLRYGKTEEIRLLEENILKTEGMDKIAAPAVLYDESLEIEQYRNVLNRLHRLSEWDSALVRLQTDKLENPAETNLLEFVLQASQKMEQYSDYLMYATKTPHENSYSKFVQILFEQRGKDIWDFYLKDQTLEGTSSDQLLSGYQSVGSVDLMVYHNNTAVGIIEAVKLGGVNTYEIEKHIRKIPGYNYANVPTACLLILADMANPADFWAKYEQNVLPNLIKETELNDWHIVKQVPKEDIELIRQKIVRPPLYLCMTSHVCSSTNQTLHLFHIMADIRKAAAKKEAVDARKRK